ncbi:MAG: hypothetical protein KJ955_08645 [Nanoarchaeota archaeon]|nr:hypothetical protein [Nanoarchaeota archaeon]
MAQIGFSTGAMHVGYIPLEERIKIFKAAGANAVELSFGTLCAFKEFNISEGLLETLSGYELVTIHAPWQGIRYDRNSTAIIKRLKEICAQQKIYGIVVHAGTVDDYSILAESGLPFLIENMDSMARFGRLPKDFEKLRKEYDLGFVLDLQHAYANDNTMQLAGEFIDVMGDRLMELHASGQTECETHALLHKADNGNVIMGMLRANVPIILEGKVYGVVSAVEEEINLVKKLLNV